MIIKLSDINPDEIINGNKEDKEKYFFKRMKRQRFSNGNLDVKKDDYIFLTSNVEKGVPPVKM